MKSVKKIPTYSCHQWNGNNIKDFEDEYSPEFITEWGGVLEISVWVQEIKGFKTLRLNLTDWAVRNDLTGKTKILDQWDYPEQYDPA